jgi:hypothetical protein
LAVGSCADLSAGVIVAEELPIDAASQAAAVAAAGANGTTADGRGGKCLRVCGLEFRAGTNVTVMTPLTGFAQQQCGTTQVRRLSPAAVVSWCILILVCIGCIVCAACLAQPARCCFSGSSSGSSRSQRHDSRRQGGQVLASMWAGVQGRHECDSHGTANRVCTAAVWHYSGEATAAISIFFGFDLP